MATQFEPPTAYEDVDLDDAVTRGKLAHAASRGDQRARLTIRAWRSKQEPAEKRADAEADAESRRRVKAGRELYKTKNKGKPEGAAIEGGTGE